MKNLSNPSFIRVVLFLLLPVALSLVACNRLDNVPLQNYEQVNLVADVVDDEYKANIIDATLVNPWGIAVNPSGTIWIASNGSGLSQVYSNTGATLLPPVVVPGTNGKAIGQPTGIVYNGSADFVIPGTTTVSKFIYVGTDGVLSAWGGGPAATLVANNSATAVYTGLAIAHSATGNCLYAANFKTGAIDVWDKNFQWVSMPFTDPDLPADYAPFNIKSIHDFLYVAYAKADPVTHEEEEGAGLGLIDVFTTDGVFVSRFASYGSLNAPWGMAASGPGFHTLGDAILVGNFGDGHINVFDAFGRFQGQLMSSGGAPITIEGLWGLASNVPGAQPNQLFFTAGVDDETHGVFGYVVPK